MLELYQRLAEGMLVGGKEPHFIDGLGGFDELGQQQMSDVGGIERAS
jgi:hypothetical protein